MKKYKIGLCSVWWGVNDVDVRVFNNIEEQTTYFENKVGGLWSNPLNLIMKNNINPTITYNDDFKREIYEVLSKNYCVIIEYDEQTPDVKKYRYYFINSIIHTGGNSYTLELDLDDINTNYIYNNVKEVLNDVMINRAHVNRFNFSSATNTYNFNRANFYSNYNMFGEDIPDPKLQLKSSQRINFRIDENSIDENGADNPSDLDLWLQNEILGWEYYYFSADPKLESNKGISYEFDDSNYQPTFPNEEPGTFDDRLTGALRCLCVPIPRSEIQFLDYSIIVNTKYGNDIKVEQISHNNMRLYLNNYPELKASLYARKFSIKPPFNVQKYEKHINGGDTFQPGTYYVSPGYHKSLVIDRGLTGNIGERYWTTIPFNVEDGQPSKSVIEVLIDSSKPLFSEEIEIDNFSFNKNDIKDERNGGASYEPKLYDQPFRKYVLRRGGDTFEYSPLKLNGRFRILYNEALTPDITRYYARILEVGWYGGEDGTKNYTGLVGSLDTSLMVDNDKLSEMLANNKNYYMQNNANWGLQALQSATQLATGNVLGGLMGFVNTGVDIWQKGMTISNLSAAPNTIKNANGDTYFNNQIMRDGVFLEVYELTEPDKQAIYDKFKLYGYKLGILGRLSYFGSIRKNFNYIEADVRSINYPLSNTEKDRLKNKLRSIRFWYTDEIYSSNNNYERYLDV